MTKRPPRKAAATSARLLTGGGTGDSLFRLRHVVPPGSGSTLAHTQTRKYLVRGADVLPGNQDLVSPGQWVLELDLSGFAPGTKRKVGSGESDFPVSNNLEAILRRFNRSDSHKHRSRGCV
jgi:hypothetical protein